MQTANDLKLTNVVVANGAVLNWSGSNNGNWDINNNPNWYNTGSLFRRQIFPTRHRAIARHLG